MEAECLERVDLLLGGVPHARAAQLERVRQLGHNAAERRVVERAGLLCQQIHEAERALLGHVQGNKLTVRLERLFADAKCARQILHIAGAAVEIDHVVGIFLQLGVLNRAERDHVHAALLRDRAHVVRGLDALDAAAVDHALEQAAAAADGEHALAGNVAERRLKQAQLALKQVVVFHKPGIILRRIAVKFRFHHQRSFLSIISFAAAGGRAARTKNNNFIIAYKCFACNPAMSASKREAQKNTGRHLRMPAGGCEGSLPFTVSQRWKRNSRSSPGGESAASRFIYLF